MQNIEDILKANGIEGDAATAVAKAVGENYKTVAEVEQKAKKLTETQPLWTTPTRHSTSQEGRGIGGRGRPQAKIAEYEEAAKKRTEADEEPRSAQHSTRSSAMRWATRSS